MLIMIVPSSSEFLCAHKVKQLIFFPFDLVKVNSSRKTLFQMLGNVKQSLNNYELSEALLQLDSPLYHKNLLSKQLQ